MYNASELKFVKKIKKINQNQKIIRLFLLEFY